ncbi:MAG: PilZ domain-containing protein [Rhodoferax sp.]
MTEVPLTGSDRRSEERKYLRCRVQVALPGVGVGEAKAADISLGGMGVVTAYALKPGVWCRVSFSIHMPNGDAMLIDVSACVTHCVLSRDSNGYKVGLQFKELSQAQRSFIERYVRS